MTNNYIRIDGEPVKEPDMLKGMGGVGLYDSHGKLVETVDTPFVLMLKPTVIKWCDRLFLLDGDHYTESIGCVMSYHQKGKRRYA